MTDEKKNLSEAQPAPKPTKGPAIWSLVMQDMLERDVTGQQRYGTRLQSGNGRDMLIDAYQEVLDLAVYLRGEIEDRKKLRELTITLAKRELTCPHNCESRHGKQCDCCWTPESLELRQRATELLGMDLQFTASKPAYPVNCPDCCFEHCICFSEDELMAHLGMVREQISAYNVGDKPMSPPASLLREEERIRQDLARLRSTGSIMPEDTHK